MTNLNRLYGLKGEARLRYLDGKYEIVTPGDFVRCAVSGELIPIADLKYWSVARQEAYKDVHASLQRHLQTIGARA
jgi:hypothetical protein